jgi:hypothetical protein
LTNMLIEGDTDEISTPNQILHPRMKPKKALQIRQAWTLKYIIDNPTSVIVYVNHGHYQLSQLQLITKHDRLEEFSEKVA